MTLLVLGPANCDFCWFWFGGIGGIRESFWGADLNAACLNLPVRSWFWFWLFTSIEFWLFTFILNYFGCCIDPVNEEQNRGSWLRERRSSLRASFLFVFAPRSRSTLLVLKRRSSVSCWCTFDHWRRKTIDLWTSYLLSHRLASYSPLQHLQDVSTPNFDCPQSNQGRRQNFYLFGMLHVSSRLKSFDFMASSSFWPAFSCRFFVRRHHCRDRPDAQGRALTGSYASFSDNSLEKCVTTCANTGFKYAGE